MLKGIHVMMLIAQIKRRLSVTPDLMMTGVSMKTVMKIRSNSMALPITAEIRIFDTIF